MINQEFLVFYLLGIQGFRNDNIHHKTCSNTSEDCGAIYKINYNILMVGVYTNLNLTNMFQDCRDVQFIVSFHVLDANIIL